MTTEQSNGLQGIIPSDLSTWLGKEDILCLALESVQTTTWPNPLKETAFITPTPAAVMRTLLVYCYSLGVYASRDIQAMTRHDPTAQYIGTGYFPRWQEIRNFRRINTNSLKEAIAQVLQLAVNKRGENRGHFYVNYSYQRFASEHNFIDFSSEAERRLALAVQADSMALDE